MFSLIITIISIALVAALALATLYYGGSAYDQASGQARASTIVNQGQQLLGASELYYAKMGVWPASVDKLVEDGFLKDVPVVQNAVNPALAAQPWTMPLAGQPVFILETETVGACRGVNEKVYGMDGILPRLQAGVVMQCYGTSAALTTMYSVAGRNAEHLLEVARSGQAPFGEADISTDPIPAADDDAWLLKPGEKYAGLGGGEGTGGGDTGGGTTDPEPEEPALPGEYELLAYSAFGSVATNTTEQRTLTIRNKGQGPLALSLPPVLSNTALFSLAGNTCGATLAPTETCEITVAYAPTEVSGNDVTTLSFGQGEPSTSVEIELTASSFNPVTLQSASLPAARVNTAYAPFDFKNLLVVSNETTPEKELATWQLRAGSLPAGMVFDSSTGVLSGTPTALTGTGGANFTIEGTYKNNKGEQVYQIRVGEAGFAALFLVGGNNVTCAVTPERSVKCWGSGALGSGTPTGGSNVPVTVSLPEPARLVAVGQSSSCAVGNDTGSVYCWGNDNEGQLGNGGTAANRATPGLSIENLNPIKLVASNNTYCALVSGSDVRCWGSNGDYELARTVGASSQSPVSLSNVTAFGNVVDIVAGSGHFCARYEGGTMRCWGRNGSGQIGSGDYTKTAAPAAPQNLSGVTSISAGADNTCAVASSVTYCWGSDSRNQLNNSSVTTRSPIPVLLQGVSGVLKIANGQEHACALISGGTVQCWGGGGLGQLGDGSKTTQSGPVSVQGFTDVVVDISAGTYHTCASQADGLVKCWGQGGNGSLGNGSITDRATATTVSQ